MEEYKHTHTHTYTHTHTHTHTDTHENIILMDDLDIDFKNKGAEFDKLSEMYDTFNLTNLIKSETCYTKNHKSLINLFFTNKPLSFQKNVSPIQG